MCNDGGCERASDIEADSSSCTDSRVVDTVPEDDTKELGTQQSKVVERQRGQAGLLCDIASAVEVVAGVGLLGVDLVGDWVGVYTHPACRSYSSHHDV